jgi:hypothetical protein
MQSLDTLINNIQLLHVHIPQISSPGVELILIYTLLYFRSDINQFLKILWKRNAERTIQIISEWRLIDWLFTVLRPAQEYFTYMETSTLPVKGSKI